MFVDVHVARLRDDDYCRQMAAYYESVFAAHGVAIVLHFGGGRAVMFGERSGRPIAPTEFRALLGEWRHKYCTD